jgi:hypothetical protein
MTIGRWRKLLLLILLAAGGTQRVAAELESAESTARLREFAPPANAVINRKTVLSAALDYSIADDGFLPKTYFVHALFDGPDGKTFNMKRRIEDGVELRTKAGVVLVQYPMKKVWSDSYLMKPVVVRFAVMKRLSTIESRIVAQTETISYKIEP